MRRAVVLALILPFLAFATEDAHLPDLVAAPVRSGARNAGDSGVVIGIEDYAFVQDVPFAARDAEAFQSFLVYTRGVPQSRVQQLITADGTNQASRETIIEALRRAGQETRAGGTVWVFFSGHGVADPADPQKRLVLGQDVVASEASFTARGVSLDEMRSEAGSGGADVVLLLDACYGGAGRSGGELLAGTHFVVPAYKASKVTTGLEWDAAGPNELSRPLPAASQGAFSYFATGALRGWADGETGGRRDGQVTAEEAQVYVWRMLKVAGIRTQVPVLLGETNRVLSKGNLEVGPTDEAVARATASITAESTTAMSTRVDSTITTGSTSDIAALAAAAQAADAKAAAERRMAAREAEFTQATTALLAKAKQDWDAVKPLLGSKTETTRRVVEAYESKYGAAMVTVTGESRAVGIGEVISARSWLAAYRPDTGDSGEPTEPTAKTEAPVSRAAIPVTTINPSSGGNRTRIEWVTIPAGSFEMGSKSGSTFEMPIHAVHVRAFGMSRTEVTFSQYKACVDARACTPAHTDDGTCNVHKNANWSNGPLPAAFRGDDQPVTCVDWEQASDFATWAGGRLPTEAEWEYAAKAGQSYTFSGSDDIAEVAWYESNSGQVTHPVGQRLANAFGLHDMTGNVFEWLQDAYHASYDGAPTDGSAWVTGGGSLSRTWRSSCYSSEAQFSRNAYRSFCDPDESYDHLGIRVARSIP